MSADTDSKVAIYALSDRDGVVRYIGKSTNPDARLHQHVSAKNDLPVSRWVQKLRENGRRPQMRIIEWVGEDEWPQSEREWIAFYSTINPLLNIAAGGPIDHEPPLALLIAKAESMLARVIPIDVWYIWQVLLGQRPSACQIFMREMLVRDVKGILAEMKAKHALARA